MKLKAFPFTRYGTVSGTVRLVSREAMAVADPTRRMTQQATAPGEDASGYRLLVTLNRSSLHTEDAEVLLRPGMVAQVDIATGKRKVIAFLLDPIKAHLLESGHER